MPPASTWPLFALLALPAVARSAFAGGGATGAARALRPRALQPNTAAPLSTCPCDNNADQEWTLPPNNGNAQIKNLQSNQCWALVVEDWCSGSACIVLADCFDPSVQYFERVPVGNDPAQQYFFQIASGVSAGLCVTQDDLFGYLYAGSCSLSNTQLWTVSAGLALVETWSGKGNCVGNCYPTPPTPSPAPPPPALTTCACDNSTQQSWIVPAANSTGVVQSVATGQCWNWRSSAECDGLCIVMGDCAAPSAQFVRHLPALTAPAGSNWYTIAQQLASVYCLQQNQGAYYMQAYPCNDDGQNPDEEWVYNATGTLSIVDTWSGGGYCVTTADCPDPSPSTSPSPSPSLTPGYVPPSPSTTASSSPSPSSSPSAGSGGGSPSATASSSPSGGSGGGSPSATASSSPSATSSSSPSAAGAVSPSASPSASATGSASPSASPSASSTGSSTAAPPPSATGTGTRTRSRAPTPASTPMPTPAPPPSPSSNTAAIAAGVSVTLLAAAGCLVGFSYYSGRPIASILGFGGGGGGRGGGGGGGGGSTVSPLARAGAGSAQAHASASRLVSSLSAPRGAAREENVGLLSSSRATASASATQIPFKGLSR